MTLTEIDSPTCRLVRPSSFDLEAQQHTLSQILTEILSIQHVEM